jgi:putative transposase
MPRRLTALATNHYYHIFNRGVNKQPIFENKRDYSRFVLLLRFYRSITPPAKFSKFIKFSNEQRKTIWQAIDSGEKSQVDITSYCLIPNHFHLLLKQSSENGISKFLSNVQNSYAKYINIKYERIGPLFQGQFKAVLIQDEEQLLHISRYIHLNPYSSAIVKNTTDLLKYPWSSLPEYINHVNFELCNKEVILNSFKYASYKEFILNNADYQKSLGQIKHMFFD